MLGKLFKHEFKATAKVLLPLNLVLVLITVIGMIILNLNMFGETAMAFTGIAYLLLYVLAVFALFIVTYVILMIRFYKSMYSDQGYLTHTLPVSPLALLNTKLLTGVFWAFINMSLMIGSIVALFATGFSHIPNFDMNSFFQGFESAMGMSVARVVVTIIFYILLSCFLGLLMIYASISIGQLFNKYKVLAAVITYVIFYIIAQVVSTISMLIMSFAGADSSAVIDSTVTTGGFASITGLDGPFFIRTVVQSLIFIAIYYGISAYIGSKKVNLD